MPDPWSYAKESEHSHQAALFMWANMAVNFGLTAADHLPSYTTSGVALALKRNHNDMEPRLRWLHAIHNQGRDPGLAGKIRGGIAKAEGVKPGVSDLFLPVPCRVDISFGKYTGIGTYAGFYLELKIGKNTPSAEQLEFMDDMRTAGYAADWAVGWLEARKKLLDYLGIAG